MEYLWAVVLGVVQGLTEFLPISSDGHLALMQEGLGMQGPRLLMTVALHAGTLCSIIFMYRHDLVELVRGSAGAIVASRWGRAPGGVASGADRLAFGTVVALGVATLVTAPVGLVIQPWVEHLSRDIVAVGGFLVMTGLLLWGTRYLRQGDLNVGWAMAIAIGLAQGLAVLPGVSRSATTIVAALVLGAGKQEAVRFSFLAAIPAVAGALVLEGGLDAAALAAGWKVYLLGAAVSFAVGLGALRLVQLLAAGRRLHWFAAYLVPLGLALTLI